MRDTIFAPASAAGRAAVTVVRLSGPAVASVLQRIAGPLPPGRRATVRRLRSEGGKILDQALVLWFPAPGSYTGEDAGELHLHGGPAIVGGVTRELIAAGARLAEPGEFTRRAFEAGKLDLDQAEAVADLTDVETEAQARQALGQLEGALGRRYATWREALTEALAFLEAAVDFPDEDLPAETAGRARPLVDSLAEDMRLALADARRGSAIRDGYRIALIGAPNAGKSSLLNTLVGRDLAIVTQTPGTTRDVIETPLVVESYKVLIADMAGLRAATDSIEAEGVRRARAWAADAALRIWVVDAAAQECGWEEAAPLMRPGDLVVLNKSDLAAGPAAAEAVRQARAGSLGVVAASPRDGRVEEVRGALAARAVKDLSGVEFPAVTRERHAALLREALGHLERAAAELATPELAAEDLRLAARTLGRVAGRIGAEDVLDRVFASFCIGK
jgi:tRNA modification GTPase